MATATTDWQPLLDGEAAEHAQRVVHEIAALLRASDCALPFPDGPAARALFFGYMAEAWPDRGWDDVAGQCLQAAADQLADQELEPDLFHGFVGSAWVLEHLQGRFVGADEPDPHAPIDDALATLLSRSPYRGKYELMHGLTGLGVYACERLYRPAARACLQSVAERLDELALRRDDGVTWLTPPEHLIAETRLQHPDGRFTLGVAHGVPAVIALLAQACRAGVATERARPLVDGAVRWLLAQRLADARSWLPRTIDGASGLAEPSRLAWCFGDAGAGASLLYAARLLGERDWERAAIDILAYGAARDPRTVGIAAAGFCHGSAGLGHLYNRAQQATGDARLRAAARFWLDDTLARQQPGGRCAGYLVPDVAPDEAADESLLSGIAGIGLVLLAASTPLEPRWDRLFCCAVT